MAQQSNIPVTVERQLYRLIPGEEEMSFILQPVTVERQLYRLIPLVKKR